MTQFLGPFNGILVILSQLKGDDEMLLNRTQFMFERIPPPVRLEPRMLSFKQASAESTATGAEGNL